MFSRDPRDNDQLGETLCVSPKVENSLWVKILKGTQGLKILLGAPGRTTRSKGPTSSKKLVEASRIKFN